MAAVYDGIDAEPAAWIERQPLFFVATAPLAATRDDGRIAAYHAAKNATSLDGLPGLTAAGQL